MVDVTGSANIELDDAYKVPWAIGQSAVGEVDLVDRTADIAEEHARDHSQVSIQSLSAVACVPADLEGSVPHKRFREIVSAGDAQDAGFQERPTTFGSAACSHPS